MSSGPEHYAKAEELLEKEETISTKNVELRQLIATKALVHAILAQAAAVAPTAATQADKWTKVTR